MIRILSGAVARFTADPFGTLVDMRRTTPPLRVALMALLACTLVMVVIDLTYGPLAFPHTLEPGGKRAIPAPAIAGVEFIRCLGVAATIWLCLRLLLLESVRLTEALWLTVPFALALVAFELLQAATWVFFLVSGLNIYGPMVLIGFGGTLLVLVVSVRALAPRRDWLACLPVAAGAYWLGTFMPYLVLPVAAMVLLLGPRRPAR